MVAMLLPILGIAVSVVYRVVGYRPMADLLLWLSIIFLILQVLAVGAGLALWSIFPVMEMFW